MDDSRENGAAIMSAEEVQCWSSVKEDPTDFQSWIKLLQLVEQKASSLPLPPFPGPASALSLHHESVPYDENLVNKEFTEFQLHWMW